MNYVTITPTSLALSAVETEIMFSVASARAQKIEFLKIELSAQDSQRMPPLVQRVLKTLKKQGRIQLFIDTAQLNGSSTEAQYLANKYPEAFDLFKNCKESIIVKI